jgi:hypothetical protein
VEKPLYIFTTGSLSKLQPLYKSHSFEILGINKFPNGEYAFYPFECFFEPKTTKVDGKNYVIGGDIRINEECQAMFDNFPDGPTRFKLSFP